MSAWFWTSELERTKASMASHDAKFYALTDWSLSAGDSGPQEHLLGCRRALIVQSNRPNYFVGKWIPRDMR